MAEDERVVQFPDLATKSWRALREGMTGALESFGRDPFMVAKVLDELQPHYVSARDGMTIDAGTDPDDAVANLNAWITSIVFKLLMTAAEAKLDMREAQSENR